MTYYFSKFLGELPINLIPPLCFGMIIYNIPGLDTSRYIERGGENLMLLFYIVDEFALIMENKIF